MVVPKGLLLFSLTFYVACWFSSASAQLSSECHMSTRLFWTRLSRIKSASSCLFLVDKSWTNINLSQEAAPGVHKGGILGWLMAVIICKNYSSRNNLQGKWTELLNYPSCTLLLGTCYCVASYLGFSFLLKCFKIPSPSWEIIGCFTFFAIYLFTKPMHHWFINASIYKGFISTLATKREHPFWALSEQSCCNCSSHVFSLVAETQYIKPCPHPTPPWDFQGKWNKTLGASTLQV